MSRVVLVLAWIALGACAGCPLPSTDTLRELRDLNARLLVTGAQGGDRLEAFVDGARIGRVDVVDDEQVVFEIPLAPGAHDGALVVQHEGRRSCGAFTLLIEDVGDSDDAAVDVRGLAPCDDDDDEDAGEDDDELEDAGTDDGPDDGGDDEEQDDGGVADAGATRSLVELREDVQDDGSCTETCALTTQIDSEHVVVTPGDGAPVEGELSDDVFASFSIVALGASADALFAGADPGCPLAAPPPGPRVELRRLVVVRGASGDVLDEIEETVDATGCPEDGPAGDLRAYVALLRDLAGLED